MSEQQGWPGFPQRQHIDGGSLEIHPSLPVVIACCGCGQWLDAGPSIAAGWLPLLVQCQDCGAA